MAEGGSIDNDIEKGIDDLFEFPCSLCQRNKKNIEAEKFCTDCGVYFCLTCVKVHDISSSLIAHKIFDKVHFVSEQCTQHQKSVYLYCQDHDVVGCSACIASEHSVCVNVFLVPELIERQSIVENSTSTENKLKTITGYLKDLQNIFIQERERLLGCKDSKLDKIRKLRIKINKRFDELEKNTITDIEQEFKLLIDKIETELKEFTAALNEVKHITESLKLTGESTSQKFVVNKKANAVASHAEKTISLKQGVVFAEVDFTTSFEVRHLLKDRTLTFGYIGRIEKRPPLLQVNMNMKFNVNTTSDKYKCSIISVCTLPDETVILADYGNQKLKRLNGLLYDVRDCCDLPAKPDQICTINNHEIAICCPNVRRVQLVSVGSTMQITRQIRTDFNCHGLAYADDKFFISSHQSVFVYTLAGEELERIYTDDSTSFYDNLRGTDMGNVAFSSDKSKMYVVGHSGSVILDRNGKQIGKFDISPDETMAFCLHMNGNVLVCGRNSRNILQFSAAGKLIGEILKTDNDCRAICCNQNKSKLVIGFENKDEIEVFHIS